MPTAAHGPSTTLTITNDDDGLERLRGFGSGWYACTYGWADACFELCEALLCASGPISSVPSLSLEPCFRRFHGSLYKALGRATIDAEAMRDLLVAHRPPTWPLVFAVDESTWARCDAETSPGRGFYYSASTHSAGQPIVAGWSYYQWITQLDWACDSWTAPMDAARIPPTADGVAITVGQIRDLATPPGEHQPGPAGADLCLRRRLRPGRADPRPGRRGGHHRGPHPR